MLEDLSIGSIGAYNRNPWVREEIKPRSLKAMDLEQELLTNYQDAKDYLTDLKMMGEEIPANQVAQVMNTINSIMKEIVKMQQIVHSIEKIKKLESAMAKALEGQPDEVKLAFIEEYQRHAEDE